jgi:hypothetical protein
VEEKGASSTIVIAVVVAISAVAIGGYVLLTRRGMEFKTFTNEHYSFKFDYPTGWHLMESVIPYDAQFLATENTPENTYPYTIDWKTIGGVIRLVVFDKNIYENQFGVSLDNLTSYVSSLENRFKNENFVLRGKPIEISISNHSGVRYQMIWTAENVFLQGLGELIVKDNFFYTFTMGSLEENYSVYEPIFEHVIDTFST